MRFLVHYSTLFLSLLLASAGLAQFDTAQVLGTIRTADGAPAPEVVVTLTNVETNLTLSVTTDAGGNYTFASVPVGRYAITTGRPGFLEGRSEEFQVTVNARQRVDFEIYESTVSSSVDVTAQANLLEADSSDRGQLVNEKQIVELPLNGRAYSELAFLAPGIIPSPSSGTNFNDREGAFIANGLRSTFTNYLLDGIDNNYYGTSNQGFSNQVTQLPPDAVAEFRVVTNNTSAEYGRSGGATVNVVLRSGTNDFHGSVWEFFRNTKLNAVGFFQPASGEKPQLNRNQFGFTFGGPVLLPGAYNGKNKTFFFIDYEGFREVESEVKFATLPTEQQRQGIVGVPVVDVVTQTPYLNGVVPRDRMTDFSRAIFDALPPTTSPGAANNYQRLVRQDTSRDKGDAKIDHNFSPNVRAFFHYTQSRADNFDPGVIPGLAGGDGNGSVRIPVVRLAGGVTAVLNPTSILEARFGFSRSQAGKVPVMAGGPSMEELFGIPGLPTDPAFTGGVTTQVMVGFSRLGRQFTNPQFQHPWVYNPKVNFTKILGKHTLKTGGEIQWINVRQQDIHPVYGLDAYQGGFSGLALPPEARVPGAGALYSLADFMFGQRAVYLLASPSLANIRQRMFFGYLQDDIKLTPKLTLNLGLRYEYATPIFERDNRLSNFNFDTLSIETASDSDRYLVDPDTNNFAPRIGLAYSVTPKTVLRAGYGISYVHWNRLGSSYLTLSPPFAITSLQLSIPGQPGFRPTQFGYPENYVTPEGFNPKRSLVQHMPEDIPTGQVQSWFFNIQQELGRGWLFDVAYVGNYGNDLQLINDLNQAFPGVPGQLIPVEFRRRIPQYSSIPGIMPWGFSSYHGLQAKIERRIGGGLYLLNSFTYSKAIDNGNQPLDNGAGGDLNPPSVQNIFDLNADKGLSDYDRTFVNSTSVVWEIPVGRGRRFSPDMGKVADLIVGGWQITAINQMRSGAPVTLFYVPGLGQEVSPVITVFGRNMYRPNILRNPLAPEAARSHDNYLDPAAVLFPPQDQPFGNSGRNIVRSPSFYQLDLGLYKSFTITERFRLQFRAESFNILNRTNFGAPDSDITSQGFGTIRSTFDQRQFQLALKLQF